MAVTSPDTPRRRRQPLDAEARERLQRRAVWLMFTLAMATLLAVSAYRLAGFDPIAQPPGSAIAAERSILLERQGRNGAVLVRDAETGAVIANSSENKNGFIDTIGRVVDRQRKVRPSKKVWPSRNARRCSTAKARPRSPCRTRC
jgi:hypothetical protein